MKINEIIEGTRCWKGYKKKGMKTMFGKRVPNCVKNEDVTKGNFGGVIYPKLPHEEVLDAISSWEYGDTPIELTNGYVINAREEGYNDDDNAWVLLDPQGKIVDAGEGSIEGVMQDFTPIAIEENFPIPPTNDKLLQKIRDWQIRGTATGDSELFSICHNYLMDPDKPMAGKLEVIQKIDLAMDMDSSETPTEKDVYDYIRNSGVDMPFNSPVGENLRAWFGKGKKGGAGGGGWDRYNTKGERIGKCGDAKKGEGKPKCLSKSRAASLRAKGGKKAIAAAVRKKRREDPNKNRKGKAKNVSNTTKKYK